VSYELCRKPLLVGQMLVLDFASGRARTTKNNTQAYNFFWVWKLTIPRLAPAIQPRLAKLFFLLEICRKMLKLSKKTNRSRFSRISVISRLSGRAHGASLAHRARLSRWS
jgi:hypothetical protein